MAHVFVLGTCHECGHDGDVTGAWQDELERRFAQAESGFDHAEICRDEQIQPMRCRECMGIEPASPPPGVKDWPPDWPGTRDGWLNRMERLFGREFLTKGD